MPITVLFSGLPSRTMPQADFDAASENYMANLPTWSTQANALEENVNAKEASATGSAAAALSYRNTAQGYSNTAGSYRDQASAYASVAQGYATDAAASAAAAASSAAALVTTSATPNTLGAGTMTFTVEAGKSFQVNATIQAVDQANPANAVYGTVASYVGPTLQINTTGYIGSGTISAWNISVTGQRGQQGAAGGITGGSLTGALNEAKGADLASATTLDVWSGTGNLQVVTGSVNTTGFTAAPQAGARRHLLAAAGWQITSGANVIVKGVPSGQTYTCTAGDEVEVEAETTTKFRVTIYRGDGLPTSDGGYMQVQDQRPAGTNGGIASSNTETIRALSTMVYNSIVGATLSAGRITLPGGIYDVTARAPAGGFRHRLRLRNFTDSTYPITGQVTKGDPDSATSTLITMATLAGRIIIPSAKSFDLPHYIAGGVSTYPLGEALNQSGVTEVYTSIEIRKVG